MLEFEGKKVNGTIRAGARKSSLYQGQAAEREKDRLKESIVNADDLGWTEGVNRGIADAFETVCDSASMLANGGHLPGGAWKSRGARRGWG